MKHNSIVWAVGIIAVAVILSIVAVSYFGQTSKPFGTAGITNLSGLNIGTNGSDITGIHFGSCIIHAYATTIAASSTATVDCQSGAAALTAITGVSSGDTIMAVATTSISSVYNGVQIMSVNASSTNGYITMTLFNGTGATFTWSGTASSTIKYIDLH